MSLPELAPQADRSQRLMRALTSVQNRLTALYGKFGRPASPPESLVYPDRLVWQQALNTVVEQPSGEPGIWQEELCARGAWLTLTAWLQVAENTHEGYQLDLRRMHPVVLCLVLYPDCYVPYPPHLERGLHNAARLRDFLQALEGELGAELFGIECPRFPSQACSWGFLAPHDVPRSC